MTNHRCVQGISLKLGLLRPETWEVCVVASYHIPYPLSVRWDMLVFHVGLGVAHAIHDYVESEGLRQSGVDRAVFLCGPGPDANIGIIAARHYKQLGTMSEVDVVTLGHIGPEQGLLLALAEEEGVEVSSPRRE